ncbi:hypothetical protein Tco_1155939 [Tanacetum coccineum]
MDPHTSLRRLFMDEHHRITLNDMIESEGNWDGPEYLNTVDSGKKKEVKAFTFHRMETEEVCERNITPCFMEGLDAYDGVTDLEYEKNLILNEFAVQLGLKYEAIVDFRNEILTIYPDIITFNSDSDDELDALLASVNFEDLPPLDI